MVPYKFICVADGLSRDKYAFYEDHTNDVFDQILESVRKSEKLDPLKLPEQVSKFDKKVLVRFHGEAKLYNGTLTGISTIHRTGNSRFNMTEYGIDVFADVALGALDVNYKAHIKFMGKGPTVDMHVHIAYVRLLAEVAQGKESEMALKQFKVLRLDGFKLKINGLGPLSAIFNFFTKHFTNLFKNQVKNKVEKVIRGTLIKKIKELKLAF